MNRIRSKLMLVFVLVSVIPLIITGLIAVDKTRQTIRNEVEDSLNTIADFKVTQIQKYFDNRERLGLILAKSPQIKSVMQRLPEAFFRGLESSDYLALDREIRDFLDYYREMGDFEDIYLISDEADIVFSLQHKTDFATNLYDGPYQTAPIAYAYDLALTMRGPNFSGFQPYQPSNDKYSSFLAVPVFNGASPVGAIVLQMPIDAINAFVTDYTGLKNSGELMLVKQEFDKLLLVSPLRHDVNQAYLQYLEVEDQGPLKLAAKGKSGSGNYRDYRNHTVIAAWRYLPRLHWGMLVKIDEAEAFSGGKYLEDIILLLGIACLIVVLIVGLLFSRGLSRPIIGLVKATRRIAQGEHDYQVEVSGNDEIAELGHSFNNMTTQLKKSLEQAQAAATVKAQFLTTMSHEIRTPMNGVMGMAQLLEDTELDDEQKEYVNTINQSGRNLLTIIGNILDFSKLNDGIELEHASFDLEQVALQCVNLAAAQAAMKDIRLIFNYQARSPRFLQGDAFRVMQVIGNLLDNAIKFTESGYVALSIEVSVLRGKSAHVSIEVKDTGIGIAPDVRDKIFDAFSQADQSISRRHNGIGLGLAACRQIVELMGGDISVDSAAGEGSRFVVGLNLQLDDEETSVVTFDALAGATVILVDENPLSRCGIHALLDEFAATVAIFNNFEALTRDRGNSKYKGAEKLVMIHAGNDLESALDSIRDLRADPVFSQSGILLYAPLSEDLADDTFIDSGVDMYLGRFYSCQQLWYCVDKMLRDRVEHPSIRKRAS